MLVDIFRHTPAPIWALLAGLVVLGLAQTRTRELGPARLRIVPAVLAALSAFGVVQAFGLAPLAVGGWLVGLAVVRQIARAGAGTALGGRGVAPGSAPQTLRVPGSWLPLGLILGLFAIKYTVGVTLAMHPAMAHDATLAAIASTVYGGFAGAFLGRAAAIRRAGGGAPTGPAFA